MDNHIGEFLRSRRARITPVQAGISEGTQRRRVPGLRREELAQLAGVSVDYYVRLERGRSVGVSDQVLHSVAAVLQLSEVEREHLGNLARPARLPRSPRARQQRPDPVLARLIESMPDVPAMVLGRRMDILAFNAAAEAVFAVSAMPDRNGARHTFLDPQAPSLYRNWDGIAREVVAYLRLEAGRFPRDPALASLIGELSIRSADFRRLWATNDVLRKSAGLTEIAHSDAGDLDFGYRMLAVTATPDQFVAVYTYPAQSVTEERLRMLLSWRATSPSLDDRARQSP